MADVIYDRFFSGIFTGAYNLSAPSVYVALMSGTYFADQVTDNLWIDVSGNEVDHASAGYVSGGQVLSNNAVTTEGASPGATGVFDADNVTWSSSTITASGAVIYQSGDPHDQSPLIAFVDFASDKSSSNGDFTITWNSSGIFRVRQG